MSKSDELRALRERAFRDRPAQPRAAVVADSSPMDAASKTAVYRHYDASGELLYVGATYQPQARDREHQRVKDWWPLVARTETVYYDSRAKALAAESAAVSAEDPSHNKQLKKQLIAPPGVCSYCDARRAGIAAAVARHRARKRRAKAK